MLVIYNKDATTFNNLGLGILKDFYSNPLITEVLNGEYNLEFEYISEGWLADKLEIGNIIKARGQLFRIWNIQPDLKKIKVLAKHIFFDLSKNFLEDVSPTNLTSQNALTWILARTNTENDYTVTGDCTATSSARYVRKNVIDAIYNEDNALLKKFGGELELNNFSIYVHQKRGSDSGISVMYGKNLSGVQMDVDLSTVVTKIMPQGKDGLLLDELYVESPLIENYFSPFYQKIEFSDIGVDEDNNISESDAKNQLRLAAQKLFNEGIDKPTISIKFDFIELSKATEYKQYENLETVSLGDTVKAIIPKLNVRLETRVVKTVYDCLLERTTKIECGTVTPNIVTKQSENTREITNKLQEIDVSSILSEAQANATDLINHPFGGRIFISESTGELYIMNTSDPNTATQVWKWGLGGLGFSSNGISGPYGIAMTQDGKINADYITTGTLSASVIEGYENLLIQVNRIVNLVLSVENMNYVHIENAMKGQLQELTIKGNINLLYPSNDLYPSNLLYPLDTYLIVDVSRTLTQNAKRYHLPFTNLTSSDQFKYSKGKCYIIHSDETIDELEDIDIQLFEGDNYLYLESFPKEILLPTGYTQVDYIKAHRVEYIDTGYYPNPNTRIESVFQYTQTTPVQMRVFGNSYQETDGLSASMYINGSGKFAWACQNGRGNWKATTLTADTNKHKFIMDMKNDKIYIDDYVENITTTHTNTAINSLLLPTYRNTDGSVGLTAYGKIYSFKIYDNDILVRDFIPCYRNSDNEVGLYDLVNNVFYTNQGAGTFAKGPETVDLKITSKYVVKNEYSDVFSTKAEMYSAINQTSQSIDLKLEKKTDKDNIIAQINMSTEKDNNGSYIGIEADKLNFKGKKFNLTADDVEIISNVLNVDKNGIIVIKDTATGNVSNFEIIKNTGEKCDVWGRSIEFTESASIHSRFGLNSLDIYNGPKYLSYDQGNLYISGQVYPSSLEKLKKNFEKLENGLDIINDTEIYKYNMKYEDDNSKKHIGFVIGDNYKYSKEITSIKNNSVDLYSMVAVAYKAIQEQQEEIKKLREMIKNGIYKNKLEQ